jgi:hypothetical protein
MDVGMRVMQLINISTSLTLVRFLSEGLEPMLSSLDMCVSSVLVLALTMGSDHVISTLSRRLAVLLILENVKPFIVTENFFDIQRIMVNMGIISVLAVVPPALKQSQEAQTLISAIVFMYSDILLFLVAFPDMHLALLVVSFVASCLLSRYEVDSSIFSTTVQITSIGLVSLAIAIIMEHVEREQDAAVMQLLLMFTVLHCVSIPSVSSVEDYLLYRVAGIMQKNITSDAWLWCGFLLLLSKVLSWWIGLRSWATRITILVLVNLVVALMIGYIKTLAIFDTIVTLKTSALVIQFVMHELSSLTFTGAQTTRS